MTLEEYAKQNPEKQVLPELSEKQKKAAERRKYRIREAGNAEIMQQYLLQALRQGEPAPVILVNACICIDQLSGNDSFLTAALDLIDQHYPGAIEGAEAYQEAAEDLQALHEAQAAYRKKIRDQITKARKQYDKIESCFNMILDALDSAEPAGAIPDTSELPF